MSRQERDVLLGKNDTVYSQKGRFFGGKKSCGKSSTLIKSILKNKVKKQK